MSADWAIGMEVECYKSPASTRPVATPPVLGGRYVIREVFSHFGGEVTLNFTTLSFAGNAAWAPGYLADFFRPITKRATSIEVFKQLLISPKVSEPA